MRISFITSYMMKNNWTCPEKRDNKKSIVMKIKIIMLFLTRYSTIEKLRETFLREIFYHCWKEFRMSLYTWQWKFLYEQLPDALLIFFFFYSIIAKSLIRRSHVKMTSASNQSQKQTLFIRNCSHIANHFV